MKGQIWFKLFCYLINKLVLEKKKVRAHPEYQFKPIIIGGHGCVNLEKMEI